MDDDDDEIPTRRPISDTCNRLKADMIVSLFRYMSGENDEDMIELHLDRYKIKQENGQTILSFKKGDKWSNLTSKRTDRFREKNFIEKIMTNIHLKNLGISILDITPTDLEMNDLTPQQLEDVVKKSNKNHRYEHRLGHARISWYRQSSHKDNWRTEKQRPKIDRD